MELSEQQVHHFRTFGYLALPRLFEPDEIAWVIEEFEIAIRTVGGGDRQDPEHMLRRLKIDPNQSRELFGLEPRDFPGNVALETKPGDLVCFNHDTYHSSWGGGTQRRMFTMNCTRHYHTDADHLLGRRYLSIHSPAGYMTDTGAGRYFPLTLDTAPPARMTSRAQARAIHCALFRQ